MVEFFGYFLFPRSQKIISFQKSGTQKWTKVPISPSFWGIGFVFLGLEPNNNLDGQEDPNCPGRMNTSHEQETSIIYRTYVSYLRTAYRTSDNETGSYG